MDSPYVVLRFRVSSQFRFSLLHRSISLPVPLISLLLPSTQKRFKLEHRAGAKKDAAFDEAAFESKRLSLDAEAREVMAETSKKELDDHEDRPDPKAWKWVIRKRVWDLMDAHNFAQSPRPVHHRIPNFVGAAAAQKLTDLEVFRVAECVKVNPDSPQKQVRFLTLSDGKKKLLTPQPRLRTGFFSVRCLLLTA